MTHTINTVQPRSLAERLLVLSCAVANVVTKLGAADEANISVDFVRLFDMNVSIFRAHKKRGRRMKETTGFPQPRLAV